MALPSLDKTWNFQVNQSCGNFVSVADDIKDFLLKLKNSLVALGWTVWGSSNSVNAGNGDGVDRWVTVANVVGANAGSPHSWIVLKNTALATNAAILIDYSGGSTSYSFSVSVTGFGAANSGVDGTNVLAPTGSGVYSYVAGVTFCLHQSNATFKCKLHVIASTDLECTRVFVTSALYPQNVGVFIIEKSKNPVVEWLYPVYTVTTAFETRLNSNQLSDGGIVFSKQNSTSLVLRYTGEGIGNANGGSNNLADFQPVADDNSAGSFPMFPINILCSTVGHRNWRKGSVYDMWWGSYNVRQGTTYPSNGTKQFAQFGRIIVPWNGTDVEIG